MMKNRGATLVELLIVMVIFIAVIILSTNIFEKITSRGGQQSRSAQTQITGRVGLEMMRAAIGHAGYGLFWTFQTPVSYTEVDAPPANGLGVDSAVFTAFNDTLVAPRAVVTGASANGAYLVIKSTMAGMDPAPPGMDPVSRKWSYLNYTTSAGANVSYVRPIAAPDTGWTGSDRSIIINTSFAAGESKFLAMNGSTFYYTHSDALHANFMPTDDFQKRIAYGVAGQNLRMPYNRTDFYLDMNAPKKPSSCNPGTGVLYMAVAGQNGNYTDTNGATKLLYPLLDCVGDLQVSFDLQNADGSTTLTDTLSGFDAAGLRGTLKTVRVFLLAQEGKKDTGFSYPGDSITVGADGLGSVWTPTTMSAKFGSDWRNYRWNVYSYTVNLKNLW
jgi:hypothetical protein